MSLSQYSFPGRAAGPGKEEHVPSIKAELNCYVM